MNQRAMKKWTKLKLNSKSKSDSDSRFEEVYLLGYCTCPP